MPDQSPQSGIQGFYDPAPLLSKSLRVRYLFRGQMHYAEIPDYVPVVLPLEGAFCHLIAIQAHSNRCQRATVNFYPDHLVS